MRRERQRQGSEGEPGAYKGKQTTILLVLSKQFVVSYESSKGKL